MLKAIEAGVPRSKLKDLWKTSYSEVDRMVARARAER
jgi:hypothetical protein